VSVRLVERAGRVLAARTDRRGFLARAALAGSALAVDPIRFALHPTSAYAFTCRCGNPSCSCASACCDGYTEFCCTLNGANTCPPGTFAGGWWKADGSIYCQGPRYYIDCHTQCACGSGCIAGGQSFCDPACDPVPCKCHANDCANRVTGCITFRYGQCHTEIACSGRIVCRVVSCTPAYLLDTSCSTGGISNNATANHIRPCALAGLQSYGFASGPSGGVWVVGRDGGVFGLQGAPFYGSMGGQMLKRPVIGMAATKGRLGYWLVASDGGIFCFGDAAFLGSTGALKLAQPVVGMAPTPSGRGYWLVASDGGVFCFGDAQFFGSTGALKLVKPVVGMAPTPTGRGYWLVASDGGVFCFGDALFFGSAASQPVRSPIGGLVPTPSGNGYLIWGQDGSVYPFGDAPTFGGYPSLTRGSVPVVGDDAFVGFDVDITGSGRAARVVGSTLWAISDVGPPPAVAGIHFQQGA
jgi:hypothetical protein